MKRFSLPSNSSVNRASAFAILSFTAAMRFFARSTSASGPRRSSTGRTYACQSGCHEADCNAENVASCSPILAMMASIFTTRGRAFAADSSGCTDLAAPTSVGAVLPTWFDCHASERGHRHDDGARAATNVDENSKTLSTMRKQTPDCDVERQ